MLVPIIYVPQMPCVALNLHWQKQLHERYQARTGSAPEGSIDYMIGDHDYAALLYGLLDEVRVRIRTVPYIKYVVYV